MRLIHAGRLAHLSYCTNIHPGESWDEIGAALDRYIPQVRARLAQSGHAPPGPFGIGLRLSAAAAASLSEAPALRAFQQQLARLDAYVFTINAFPFGAFHGGRVKEQVYQPDWRHAQRLDFTLHAAHILAQLLPVGVEGSISTVPGAFGDAGEQAGAPIAANLIGAVAQLAALERASGKRIVLALEPEPACLLESVDDVLAFFAAHLSGPAANARLAALAGCDEAAAQVLLRRHLGVCFDVCHAAVGFEDPLAALARLHQAGIAVPKIQLSCAVRIARMHAGLAEAVARLDDGVYLHQVSVRGAQLRRYTDLPQALQAFRRGEAEGEWRIHCHVPVLAGADGELASTDEQLRAVLGALGGMARLPHLEVETYTWDVLPAAYRGGPKAHAIARELAAVIDALAA
ncbi:metabolite traffic protein EboE [Massilia aquatica]|uniref:Sugar phosphate isomerase n=1 Tax=Massilia aquatica TaxID=2609000 RepID=A0ABX0M389_9BURK|nr:metabolite traffic protein EboE [Massilia aquatica]NHZ41624.1 hypothetical protein [Massilia aquatica]